MFLKPKSKVLQEVLNLFGGKIKEKSQKIANENETVTSYLIVDFDVTRIDDWATNDVIWLTFKETIESEIVGTCVIWEPMNEINKYPFKELYIYALHGLNNDKFAVLFIDEDTMEQLVYIWDIPGVDYKKLESAECCN